MGLCDCESKLLATLLSWPGCLVSVCSRLAEAWKWPRRVGVAAARGLSLTSVSGRKQCALCLSVCRSDWLTDWRFTFCFFLREVTSMCLPPLWPYKDEVASISFLSSACKSWVTTFAKIALKCEIMKCISLQIPPLWHVCYYSFAIFLFQERLSNDWFCMKFHPGTNYISAMQSGLLLMGRGGLGCLFPSAVTCEGGTARTEGSSELIPRGNNPECVYPFFCLFFQRLIRRGHVLLLSLINPGFRADVNAACQHSPLHTPFLGLILKQIGWCVRLNFSFKRTQLSCLIVSRKCKMRLKLWKTLRSDYCI